MRARHARRDSDARWIVQLLACAVAAAVLAGTAIWWACGLVVRDSAERVDSGAWQRGIVL